MKQSTSRLEQLTDLMRENSISRIELAELEELLQVESNLEEYVRLTAMDSMLTSSFDNGGADSMDHLFPHPAIKQSHKPSHGRWFWGGIAAAITLGITGFWMLKQAAENINPVKESTNISELSRENKTTAQFTVSGWVGLSAEDQLKFPLGAKLENSSLSLSSGLLEIETSFGDHLIVEAPAQFHLKQGNRLHLNHGKVFVESLNHSQSIELNYGNGYSIRDGDTYAVVAPKGGADDYEVSSFRGKLVILSNQGATRLSVADHESLRHQSDGTAKTIPFNGDQFFRHLPQQDIMWATVYNRSETVSWVNPSDPNYNRAIAFNTKNGQSQQLRYGMAKAKTLSINVSGLVWKPGEFRAVLKWIRGTDAMIIENVQLYQYGKLVSEDKHLGKTGTYFNTSNHIYKLTIPSDKFQKGGWELRARVRGAMRDNGNLPEITEGVLHFGSNKYLGAEEKDYVGDWEYQFNGDTYMRKVKADGTLALYKEGKALIGYTGNWWIKDGIMYAKMRTDPHITELHMLRDKTTLIFLDRPYSNARKQPQRGAPL